MAKRSDQPTLFDCEEPAAEPVERAGHFVEVALNRPVRREFTYSVPEAEWSELHVGGRVAVQFANRRHVGVVVSKVQHTTVPAKKLRSVLEVLDTQPVVGDQLLRLTHWIGMRYACSWGEALAAALPATLKRESGSRQVVMAEVVKDVGRAELKELEERFSKQHRLLRTLIEIGTAIELRDLLRQLQLSESPARSLQRRGWVTLKRVNARLDVLAGGRTDRVRPEKLSPEQEGALDKIENALDSGTSRTFLVQGVTGSGKTEIYLRAIEKARAMGRTAIVLVPEIALTPQTVSWFRSRFGEIAVLHSGMTDAQRLEMWRRLKSGEASVVVGARSAIFAPLENLGVIVVDEEHEPSFKQGSVPRYHARDVAVERARLAGAVCLLGSATPSMESWHAAQVGTYEPLVLRERVGGGTLPNIQLVDMRGERDKGQQPLFSRPLRFLLRETLEHGEQAILFLNRRGYTPVLFCPGCEKTVRCVQCDVSLNLHRRIQRMVCHACCEEIPVPSACPDCSRPGLRSLGAGSQKVENELSRLLPGVRVRRMDSDTMRRRDDYEEVLGAFGRHELDVLVGTQMIAKGLDFPRVTLVGVLNADQSLHGGDFRASERTYQLISQVAGRAGRSELAGRIVVQSVMPESSVINHSVRGDFDGFASEECESRRGMGWPPFGRLFRATLDDEVEERAKAAAETCHRHLTAMGQPHWKISEPAPAGMARLRGRYRYDIVVRVPGDAEGMEEAAASLAGISSLHYRTRLAVDVDPASLY